MERNITITLEKAREWYNSNNESLKEVALQAFDENELMADYTNIKTFKNACDILNIDYKTAIYLICGMAEISKASAAMFQLNIIRKALNLGQDLHLTKDPKDSYIYCPYNIFITKDSIYYKTEINSGKFEIIGKIKSEGKEYYVLGNYAYSNSYPGLGSFISHQGVSTSDGTHNGFLGCASRKIAQHFSKYFGMLITEAKYGDMVDFEIVERKYQ